MKETYVYCIRCKENGRVYVGSTTYNVGIRASNHKHFLRRGKHRNKKLQDDWIKFGESAFVFETLWSGDFDNLLDMERKFIKELNAMSDDGYNRVNPPRSMPLDLTAKFHGRPRLGNVLFARRLSPEKIKEVESLLSGATLRPLVDDAYKRGCEEDKNSHNIKALLDDVERLTKEVENLKDQLEKCARATDDQKAAYWRNRAIMAESSQRTNPYDQEAK